MSFDAKTRAIALEDGSKLTLKTGLKTSTLKVGEKVNLTYHTLKNGNKLVTSYKVVA